MQHREAATAAAAPPISGQRSSLFWDMDSLISVNDKMMLHPVLGYGVKDR